MSTPKRRRASATQDQTQTTAVENDSVQPGLEENHQTAQFAAEVAASEAAQIASPAVPGTQTYVTKDTHTGTFDILVAGELIYGTWDNKRERVIFRVPNELTTRFEMHAMYQDERIIKA